MLLIDRVSFISTLASGRVFDFELREMTMIGGEAATGKTLFYNELWKLCRANYGSGADTLLTMDNVYFFDYKDIPGIEEELPKLNRKLILIDNWDRVAGESLKVLFHVRADMDNQYILIGRNWQRAHCEPKDVARIVTCDNISRLEYMDEINV